jgi:hypothetical protein
MLTDQQKTDIRRFCGYPAYGASPAGNIGWRFYVAYGLLEYRMNNLSVAEIAVVLNYLSTLNQLEAAVPTASDNLDSDAAASVCGCSMSGAAGCAASLAYRLGMGWRPPA